MKERLNITAIGLSTLLAVAFGNQTAGAADCETKGAAQVEQIADGIFVRQGVHGPSFETEGLANIGFVVGSECVAAIDSGASVDEGRALRCAIAAATELPVCYLIISHHHYDHSMGSLAFRDIDNLKVVAHEKFAVTLQQSAEYYLEQLTAASGDKLTADHIVLPDQTVATGGSLELDLGGRHLHLHAHAPAHTNNDLSIVDSQTGALWAADLVFLQHIPSLDTGVGSINGWIDEIDALKADHPADRTQAVIPGHGPVKSPWPDGIWDTERYLKAVRDQVRAIIADGGTLKEAMESVGSGETEKWSMFDYHHRRTVNKAFVELEWE